MLLYFKWCFFFWGAEDPESRDRQRLWELVLESIYFWIISTKSAHRKVQIHIHCNKKRCWIQWASSVAHMETTSPAVCSPRMLLWVAQTARTPAPTCRQPSIQPFTPASSGPVPTHLSKHRPVVQQSPWSDGWRTPQRWLQSGCNVSKSIIKNFCFKDKPRCSEHMRLGLLVHHRRNKIWTHPTDPPPSPPHIWTHTQHHHGCRSERQHTALLLL